jgi:hypothetical protein
MEKIVKLVFKKLSKYCRKIVKSCQKIVKKSKSRQKVCTNSETVRRGIWLRLKLKAKNVWHIEKKQIKKKYQKKS